MSEGRLDRDLPVAPSAPLARLILYVLEGSRLCEQGAARVVRAVACCERGDVALEIRNLSRIARSEWKADDRAIVAVPTLVMTYPERGYLMGDLEPESVLRFLRMAGVEPRRAIRRAPR